MLQHPVSPHHLSAYSHTLKVEEVCISLLFPGLTNSLQKYENTFNQKYRSAQQYLKMKSG